MTKKIIAIAVALALVLAIAGCASGVGARSSWSGRNIQQSSPQGSWTITAAALRGHSTRTLDLTAEELATLYINSTIGGGEVQLTISQDDVLESVYLTGEFGQVIDTSAFEPGQISLRLDFWQAEDLIVHMRW